MKLAKKMIIEAKESGADLSARQFIITDNVSLPEPIKPTKPISINLV